MRDVSLTSATPVDMSAVLHFVLLRHSYPLWWWCAQRSYYWPRAGHSTLLTKAGATGGCLRVIRRTVDPGSHLSVSAFSAPFLA